jgi:PKD domain
MRERRARFLRHILAIGSSVLLVSISASAHGAAVPSGRPFVSEPVAPHVFTGDLRSLPVPPPFGPNDYVVIDEENEPEEGQPPPPPPALKRHVRKLAVQFTTPERSFEGIDQTLFPPDPNGDVGPNHYIQMVNSRFQVYDKQGNALLLDTSGNPAPRAINQLWKNFGGLCETTNRGDPVVLYDPIADRWLLSQFAFDTVGSNPPTPIPPYEECIAVSRTGDPVAGGWNLYDFNVQNSKFPDYPHFGVWPDAYYMSTRQTGGLGGGNYAFDRAAMLAGQPASFIYFDTNVAPYNNERLVPTDLDGSTPPPAGEPNPFLRIVGPSTLEIWNFSVDWGNPGASTFALAQSLATMPFDLSVGLVPQSGTSEGLEVITDRPMHRIAYRNFGSSEAIVTQNVVDADGTNHAGVKWYELRRSGGAWSIAQQGTFAPDADHRWNPSIAVDRDGNIALGYSVTGAVFPSLRYAGRLVGDPAGSLPQGEGTIVNGTASQQACPVPQGTCRSRWGDYSALSVDPVDDCTFWYTGEYFGSLGRQTRIGAFRFCNDPPTADAGGPYTTDEGAAIELDGTGSADPNPTDSLTYVWDLDNNGTFETSGATPSFANVGQDGVFTVRLRVTDTSGATDVDTTTVTVHNVAPTIVVAPNAPVNENSPITVTGSASDPGWQDILSGTIDWGDGTVQPLGGALENNSPDATLTFSISHTYGDDGVFGFGAKICVADDDTAPCVPLALRVLNVPPTAVIDLSAAIIVNGVPTLFGTAGQPLTFHGSSKDPGSDDLTLTWDFGDGPPAPDAVVVSLVNPPFTDPDPSPQIKPRDVTDDEMHVFGDACSYTIHFASDDDDGGHAAATANVLIQGAAAGTVRNAAYWMRQYGGKGKVDFDQATLECYLAIANYVSTVFSEHRDAATIPAAFGVLTVNDGAPQVKQFDAQLLAALLNLANGGLGVGDLPTIAAAEAVRVDPAATTAQILAQRKKLQALNAGR